MGIKDFLPEKASLYKYTWEVVVYMVIIGKGHSGLDIWPRTLNLDIGIEDIILRTLYKKAIKQWKLIFSIIIHQVPVQRKFAI